jgi:hypothetical protein
MKALNLIIVLSFISALSVGQNLVPNHSFEEIVTCPTDFSQLLYAPPWTLPPNTTGTNDLYNACDTFHVGVPTNYTGYQNAHTGVGYAGFFAWGGPNLREYLQVQLTSPLVAGEKYYVEMYVSPSEEYGIAIDALGIYLSANAVAGSGNWFPLPYTPQISNPANSIISDSLNWTCISGSYTAAGGENYLTIGNFKNDVSTDTLLFNPPGWYRAYYYIDDVSVSFITGAGNLSGAADVKVWPNPFFRSATIRTSAGFNNAGLYVYNATGIQVRQTGSLQGKEFVLDRRELPAGIYYLVLKEENSILWTHKIMITDW